MTGVLEANISPSPDTTPHEEPFNVVDLLPRQLEFAAPPSRRLRFKKPISLKLYADLDSVVAYSPDLEEFGNGENVAEALDDFGKTIAEAYDSLQDEFDVLGENLKQHFLRLQDYIEPARHNE